MPVVRSLDVKRTHPIVPIALTTVMVLGAIEPLMMPRLIGTSDVAMRVVFALAVCAELCCCAGWLLVGPRSFRGRHKGLAKAVRFTCAVLSMFIGAFWIWSAYLLFYVGPNI